MIIILLQKKLVSEKQIRSFFFHKFQPYEGNIFKPGV